MPGLIRIILLGFLFGILYSFFRKFQKKLLTHKKGQTRQEGASSSKMLRCEHCGVYLPESDAIKEGEHVYCSVEHKEISNEH